MSVLPSTRLTKQPPTYSHPRQWHIIISPQPPLVRELLAILTSAHNCRHPSSLSSSSSSSHKSGKRRRGIKTNNPIGRDRTAAFLSLDKTLVNITSTVMIIAALWSITADELPRFLYISVSPISSASRKRCPNVTKSHQRGFYRLAQFSIVGRNFSPFFFLLLFISWWWLV